MQRLVLMVDPEKPPSKFNRTNFGAKKSHPGIPSHHYARQPVRVVDEFVTLPPECRGVLKIFSLKNTDVFCLLFFVIKPAKITGKLTLGSDHDHI